MKFRILTIIGLAFGFAAQAQLTVNVSSQSPLCNGANNGSITLNPIQGCYAPINVFANNDTFTINHLAHQGFDTVVHADGSDTTFIADMWAGNNGSADVYVVAGSMDDTLEIGGGQINPTSAGSLPGRDGFIACLDQNTNTLIWSLTVGDSASANLTQVSGVTSDGNYLYATGLISGNNSLGTYQISNTSFKSFIAKINLVTGAVDTVITVTSSGFGINYPTGIDAKNGKVYVTGGFIGDAVVLAGTSYSGGVSGSFTVEDVYVLALDSNLNELWGNVANGAGSEFGRKVKANDVNGTTDRIYVSANFQNNAAFGAFGLSSNGSDDIAVAALDTNGNWMWANGFGSSTIYDNSFALEVNNEGDECFVGGRFGGSMTVGTNTYNSNGTVDGFIVGFDSTGAHTAFYPFGGGGAEIGITALDYVDNDYLVFGGTFFGNITYADSTYFSNGDTDPIIGKLRLDSHEVYAVQFFESSSSANAQFNAVAHNNGRVLGAGYFLNDASSTQAGLTAGGNYDGMITNMSILANASLNIDSLVAGTYVITAIDSNGNTVVDSVTISEPAAISVSGVVGGASSSIANDGFVDITVAGGTPGYAYMWSNAAISEDISNLTYGWYHVTVTDTNGCTALDSFYVDSIYVAPPMNVSSVITNETCFGDSNGAIDVTVTYGAPPYSYMWNTGDTTEDLTGLPQGDYVVTITDTNMNMVIDTFTVGGNPQIIINGTVMNTSSAGSGDGLIDVTVFGGTSPYSFMWSNAEITEDIDSLAEGSYTIVVTDAAGCMDSATFIVDSTGATGQPFVVTATIQNEICFGDSNGMIDLYVTGGTSPYSYTWSNGANTQDLVNITQGTYSVTVSDNDTSTFVDTFIVSGNPQIVLSGIITPPTSGTSNNGAIDLTISGGTAPYMIMWSNLETTEDIDSLAIGNYSVTVTDTLGCSATASYFVDTIPALNLVSVSYDVTCLNTLNGTIDLTVLGGVSPFSFAWSNGAVTEDVSGLAAGGYSVTVTDSVGQMATLTDTVNSNPQYPDPIAGPITGSPSVQSWNSYTYNAPPTNGSSFNWTVEGGLINTTANNVASVQWNAGPSGKLWVTETDANGCMGMDSIEVTIIFLGINEAHENTVRVYPNPNNGSFNVELPASFSQANLSVYSLNGQLMHTQRLSGLDSFITMNKLASGTYILMLENNGLILRHNIVVQ